MDPRRYAHYVFLPRQKRIFWFWGMNQGGMWSSQHGWECSGPVCEPCNVLSRQYRDFLSLVCEPREVHVAPLLGPMEENLFDLLDLTTGLFVCYSVREKLWVLVLPLPVCASVLVFYCYSCTVQSSTISLSSLLQTQTAPSVLLYNQGP